MLVHLVASSHPSVRPLAEPKIAWAVWERLRAAYPRALATCLMPSHLHLIDDVVDPSVAVARLARLLAGITRLVGLRRLWLPIPEPAAILNGRHLARGVRYVHLNPCRDALAADPLRWAWSTHRGAIGAELDPWVSADRLATALGRPRGGFEPWLHAYVSGDTSVNPAGTKFPRSALPTAVARLPLAEVVTAALAATPWSRGGDRRRAIVQLARSQGWPAASIAALGMSPRQIRRLSTPVVPEALSAALLCLGDARLRDRPRPLHSDPARAESPRAA
jgi:hypothetical protein